MYSQPSFNIYPRCISRRIPAEQKGIEGKNGSVLIRKQSIR